ncbi:MAG TPA: fasciclin domain-containing protein [Mycobacteriales bacterium]
MAVLAAAALTLSACGGEDSTPAASGGSSSAAATTSSAPSATATAGTDTAMTFGAGCAAVPASGKGSFSGMATDPVATAASNNPVLSTLVAAVTKAGLGDSLNTAQNITVFAPSNDAFAKIPKATLDKVLADKAMLTKILTYHVVPQTLTPDQLSGSFKTLEGQMVTAAGSGDAYTVGTDKANVICGNVQTANATVYIIDSVLMPPTA